MTLIYRSMPIQVNQTVWILDISLALQAHDASCNAQLIPSTNAQGAGATFTPFVASKMILMTKEWNDWSSKVQRRSKMEPIQYVLSKWDFHGISELKVPEPLLCPRAKMEELVGLVGREL